ncbi:MAG: ABC transporter ATP-binding protein [Clostridia bacterium]|jgi:putative ABC transport system ATP-binding protein|nr:ABC transporter ATP-binding protein [Clostridia bacterium]MBR3037372.1 ABC transporter ATP-binding protein [Clostridia bacterium]MBR3128958.1 ABC transporter ATP-binding protein [Clostridia bacterium]
MLIRLEHIEKTYGTPDHPVPVLHDVNFCMEEGEYYAVMGPSGSGKSTLMNILGYLDTPTAGRYYFEDVDNAKANDVQMAKIRNEKIGFVFQSFHLLQQRRAWENVALPLLYANVPKRERRERAEQALIEVGLEDRMEFYPNQLSGGQCQRVAIARAICSRPKLLLADEPTGALDSKSGQQIMDIFDELHDRGISIIMITHELAVAERARRMLHIYDGVLSGGAV